MQLHGNPGSSDKGGVIGVTCGQRGRESMGGEGFSEAGGIGCGVRIECLEKMEWQLW